MQLVPLAALEIFKMTTSNAARDENATNTITPPPQWHVRIIYTENSKEVTLTTLQPPVPPQAISKPAHDTTSEDETVTPRDCPVSLSSLKALLIPNEPITNIMQYVSITDSQNLWNAFKLFCRWVILIYIFRSVKFVISTKWACYRITQKELSAVWKIWLENLLEIPDLGCRHGWMH